jgi:glyoxylase-like metal-dependent hydrolase (beta-lactamase superfamily II)
MPNTSLEQAPGFYRHRVGDILVTALNDGTLSEDLGVLAGIDGAEATRLLVSAFLPPTPVISLSAFLLQTVDSCILIDAGGADMTPGTGRLAANLDHAGVAVDDISLILLTHMHPDHIGGLITPDGLAVFPNARLLVPDADAAVFLSTAIAETVPEQVKPVFAKARAVAAAYEGRFERFQDAPDLASGVTAVPLPGHSPGHTGYRVASGGQSLLIWGDVVHVPGLQFSHPEIGMIFDADPALAEHTRRDAFAAAAQGGELVAGMHLPFPCFGHLVPDGSAFRFAPIVWSPTLGSAGAGA